ncbi:MAG: hypothetical protein D3917_07065 [Candidatus Electrothrix sp. AX5]|nr:hypothetical protein [Candidatus Electrothrix sp. AX5]
MTLRDVLGYDCKGTARRAPTQCRMTTICRGDRSVALAPPPEPIIPGRHTGLLLQNRGYLFNVRFKYGLEKILGRFRGCFGPFLPVRGEIGLFREKSRKNIIESIS